MRCLTFQSPDVLATILSDKIYKADPTYGREKNDYSYERARLKGAEPIWLFANPEIETGITDQEKLAEFLISCHDAMSLEWHHGLGSMFCLEVEVYKFIRGQTGATSKYECITEQLTKDQLIATYTYYPKYNLVPIDKYQNTKTFLEKCNGGFVQYPSIIGYYNVRQ